MSSLSLKSLGYKIEPTEGKDEKGNEWVFQVTPPPYFIKLTKRGKMKAFKNKTDKLETGINGVYSFVEQNGDLVGSKPEPATKKQAVTA